MITIKYLYDNIIGYKIMKYKKQFSATINDNVLDKSKEISEKKSYRNFSHYVEEALKLLNEKESI